MEYVIDTKTIDGSAYHFNDCPDCKYNEDVVLQEVKYFDSEEDETYYGYWVQCDACGLHTQISGTAASAAYDWNHQLDLEDDYEEFDPDEYYMSPRDWYYYRFED